MGVVIFTNDDTKFMVGNYIMMVGEIDCPPSDPSTTYILRTKKFTEKDVEEWLPFIGNKLVICIDKPPKITKKTQDSVIIDDSFKKGGERHLNSIMAMFSWKDRLRVFKAIKVLPIPYALAFLKENRGDIKLWRRIAMANMELPDEYMRAIFAYSIEPDHAKTVWPKKKKKEATAPLPFREKDKYWKEIITGIDSVANEIRESGQELPKGVRKTKVVVNEWV